MTAFTAPDPDFERKVRESFARQAAMATLGARIVRVAPGEVDLGLPFRADLTQQHGFLHGGVITAVLDSACGYAALSLMPAGTAVLTVELKVNLVSPARGERFLARGRVVRPGRTLMVCAGEVVVEGPGADAGRTVALLQGTMMALRDREGLSD
jgi:uncharacterized protein (TIGR00369 family)